MGGESRFRALGDPLSDRAMISGDAIVLAVKGVLLAFWVALLVCRDALALAGGIVFADMVRVNVVRKASTALPMAAAVDIFRPGAPRGILLHAGIPLSLAACFLYVCSALEHDPKGHEI